jgi:hypothetical protein
MTGSPDGAAGYWLRAAATIVGWYLSVVAVYAVAITAVLHHHSQEVAAPLGGRMNVGDSPGWEPFVALLLVAWGVMTFGVMIGVCSSMLYRRVYTTVHGPQAGRPHAFRVANQVALSVVWRIALATVVIWGGVAVVAALLVR